MKRIIFLLSVIIISGCVNPNTYRVDQDIEASFTTTKSVPDTQECILAAWQRQPLLMQITSQKIGKYHSVLAVGDNVDVYTDNGVTVVNYHSLRTDTDYLDVMDGKSKRMAGIKSCL